MSNYPNQQFGRGFGQRGAAGDLEAFPYGAQVESTVLVRFFNMVYAWMASGLALTAVVAWYISTRPDIMGRLSGGVLILLFVIEIGLVIAISGAVNRISAPVATILFMLYAAIN